MRITPFTAPILIILLSTPIFSIDPESSTVDIKNIREKYYSEKVSSFSISSDDENFSLPDTQFQLKTGSDIKNRRKIIKITAGRISYKIKDDPKPDYTADTRLLNLKSRELSELSNKFHSSTDKIRSIERFVFEYITNKTEGIPVVPALSTIRSRTGDCTEHSVLTVALLRKHRIPSRAAVGMIASKEYYGKKNVFVFHMWVEAFDGKKWVTVDATRPGEIYQNRYILFAYHSLKSESPIDFLRAVSYINGLSADYISSD